MLRRWLAGACFVIAAATLVACVSSSDTGRGPESPTAVSSPSSASGCGIAPSSSGPLAQVAYLAIKAPATASVGHSLPVSATVRSKSAVPRVITTPATSALLVVRGGRVVARSLGRASAPHVPLQLRAGAAAPAQVIPKSVTLTGCDLRTAALAAGRYTLVAVLGYELDSLNNAPAGGTVPAQPGQRSFALVSAPVRINVA